VGWGKIGGKPALIFHATLTKADKSANFDGPDYSKRQTSRDLKFPSEAELKKNARGPYEPDVDPAREDEIQRLVLSGAFKRDVKIELASMRPAMDKLGTCADDLMKRWGINPEVQKTLKRRPYPEVAPGTWVTTNDYPKSMLRANRSGVVHTILVIDAQGKVSNCLDTATIIQKEFEETTCSLVKERARLYPALDAEGKPVVSFLPFILDFRI
jgi:hypothetical protein